MRRVPKLASKDTIITIAEFARRIGRPYRTTFDILDRLCENDLKLDGKCTWIENIGRKTRPRWVVNLHLLRRAHPALFEAKYVDRVDFEELSEELRTRVARLENEKRELRKLFSAVGARLRQMENALRSSGRRRRTAA